MIKRTLVVTAVALGAGAWAEGARADQVFICDDGKSITVSSAGLADAIKHDPCVAKYFGRTATAKPMPLPERKPQTALAETVTGQSVAASHSAKAPSALGPKVQRIALKERHRINRIGARLARMSSGTFRRVLVINARVGRDIFRHDR
ncbi:MAG: hypothetical protein AAFQ45_00330 [Pseudomonadota bacterium]